MTVVCSEIAKLVWIRFWDYKPSRCFSDWATKRRFRLGLGSCLSKYHWCTHEQNKKRLRINIYNNMQLKTFGNFNLNLLFSLPCFSSFPSSKGSLLSSDSGSRPAGVLLLPLLFLPNHCVPPPLAVSWNTQQQEIQSMCYCCCCFGSVWAQEPSQTAQSSDQDSSWEHFRKAFWCFKGFSSSVEMYFLLLLCSPKDARVDQ